jgi:hypothetical protein
MRRLRLSFGLAVCTLAGSALGATHAPAAAADVTVWNQQIETPVSTVITNPCGEDVAFTGTFYRLYHSVTNDNGGPFMHIVAHGEIRNASAYGVTTGGAYRFIEIGTSVDQADDVPYDPDTSTATTTAKLISPADGDNFSMHIVFHLTVTPDGDITVAISDAHIDCSG